MDYKQAGVDIEAADTLVENIKPVTQGTQRLGALGMIGGFGALFDPKAAGFVDPLIVSTTDGVGTKLKIAIETGLHDNIGIDLVAMCVNDLIVQGATPLSFLDYFATGKLDIGVAERVIRGIAEGCKQAGCVLAGGETAEMPGMYEDGHYDLAGFAFGAVERDALLPANVAPGDFLIGLTSSGVHSNGFSLVRSIVDAHGLGWADLLHPKWSLAREFLTPTKIYVKTVLGLHAKGLLNAAAHITGGGLSGNIPRVIPKDMRVVFNNPWHVPPVFGWLREKGKVSRDEMLKTFNCGIGMVVVVRPENVSKAIAVILDGGDRPVFLGRVEAGEGHQIGLPKDKYWMEFESD